MTHVSAGATPSSAARPRWRWRARARRRRSVALLAGAVFVIPVGVLVDRFRRVPMLSVSILLWSVASLLGAFAGGYAQLL